MDDAGGVLGRERARTAYRVSEDTLFARFRATRRFRSLDGLRAFAIAAVIFRHTWAPSFASPIADEGRHGVTLFFVISGFLIVTLLLRSQESPQGFSLWRFWGRRTLRILPVYYAVLLLYVVLVHFTEHSEAGAEFFHNLPFFATFTTNWFVDPHDRTIFFFSWSLAAEEQFYLFWPLIEILIARPAHKLLALGVLIVVSQIALGLQGTSGSLPHRILVHVPLGIMLGTGLAHLLHHRWSFRFIYAALGRRGSAVSCVAFAVMVAAISPFIGFAGELLVTFALLLLVASTVIREDNDLAGMLRWRPIVWVGTVSYGMYLVHMLAVNAVDRTEPMFDVRAAGLTFAAAICLACGVATFSFLYYERPFLLLKDRLFRN